MSQYWHMDVTSLNIHVNIARLYSRITPHFLFMWHNILMDCLAMATPFYYFTNLHCGYLGMMLIKFRMNLLNRVRRS